jgi:hypothetical protein
MTEEGTLFVNGEASPAERDEDGTIFSGPAVSARTAAKYSEHDKLQSVKESSQTIGEFLEWLQEDQGVVLAKPHVHTDFCIEEGRRVCGAESGSLIGVLASIPRWLARYFDIDEDKLEAEKRAMLDELRLGASTG